MVYRYFTLLSVATGKIGKLARVYVSSILEEKAAEAAASTGSREKRTKCNSIPAANQPTSYSMQTQASLNWISNCAVLLSLFFTLCGSTTRS